MSMHHSVRVREVKGQGGILVELAVPGSRQEPAMSRSYLTSPLKKAQQCALRVKNCVRLRSNSLILRYLEFEIPVAWNIKCSFSTGCYGYK